MKKTIYWKALSYPAFSKVDVIHAITPLEASHLGELFPGKRIALIPNSMVLFRWRGRQETSGVALSLSSCYSGRLHKKKGIELLIKAFAEAGISPSWSLVIAGSGTPEYSKELKELARKIGVEGKSFLRRPCLRSEKWTLYKRAWVVVVPSYSEVVGMVNLEASAAGTPTITTRQTGLAIGKKAAEFS